jgi:hypothetical protein
MITVELKTPDYPQVQLVEIEDFADIWADYASSDQGLVGGDAYYESAYVFGMGEKVVLAENTWIQRKDGSN